MKRAIAKLGARAIPGNTKLGYALKAWRKELIEDLGGDDNISIQQRTIVECASTTRLMISSLDAWITSQPSLMQRNRTLIPVIMQRQQLVNSLVSMLVQLGLERRHKVKTLQDILAKYDDDKPADGNLTQDTYMCDKAHKHHETHRIPRRRSTLVSAAGERALAACDWLPIVAHRAVYSRKLLGMPARRGSRQLCFIRAQKKPPCLGLRSPGIGRAGSTGCEQRPKAREAYARSGATVYRSAKGATGSWGFWEKEESEMITLGYQQRSLYEPLAVNCMPDYQELLWEGWLLKVDQLLEDEDLVTIVRGALEKRHPHSRTRGRLGTPAEVVLRLMALKHLRNWSYQALEREVGANVVYREFTRIRGEKVPDCKTMVRWGKALGPKVTRAIHERLLDLGHKRAGCGGESLGSIPRWRRPTFIIRPTVGYWGTRCGY
jgi:Transposase domain (DUF772)